jgi:hypothetical protein
MCVRARTYVKTRMKRDHDSGTCAYTSVHACESVYTCVSVEHDYVHHDTWAYECNQHKNVHAHQKTRIQRGWATI